MSQKKKRSIYLAAFLYAALMLSLLFLRARGLSDAPYLPQLKSRFNPIPFRTIRLFLRSLTPPFRPNLVRHAVINLAGNVLLFLPLGFFPPLLWKWAQKLWKTLLFAAGIMTLVELMQMLLLVGTCDIDDLLLNVVGAAIGYGIYSLRVSTKN